MATGERFGYFNRVPSISPVSLSAASAGDWISLKNHHRVSVLVDLGAITTSVTVQTLQATNVAGAGSKNLLISAVHRLGGELAHGAVTGAFVKGEVVTGTGGATAVIHEIHPGYLIVHTISGTFLITDTITGAGGATAALSAVLRNYGIKCRQAITPAATVALTIGGETYELEIDASSLDIGNGFDCVKAGVSAVGGTSVVGISYLLANQRYMEEAGAVSPLID